MDLKGLEIAELKMTCSRCPSQWEGHISDGRAIYIRYRSGWLTVNLSEKGGTISQAIERNPVFEHQVGDDLDGDITMLEVKRLTGLTSPKTVGSAASEWN